MFGLVMEWIGEDGGRPQLDAKSEGAQTDPTALLPMPYTPVVPCTAHQRPPRRMVQEKEIFKRTRRGPGRWMSVVVVDVGCFLR